MGIILSLLPWIALWVLGGRGNYQIAALTATALAILLSIKDVRQRNIKILDVGTLVFFIILSGLSFSSVAAWVEHYSVPLSNGMLFLIALLSLLIRKPFTLQYAYEKVAPQLWNSREFYVANRTISLVWCAGFAVNTLLTYSYVRHPYLLDWVIHLLVIAGAIKFTAWYPNYLRQKRARSVPLDRGS